MRIQETNQILKEADLERLNRERMENDQLQWWKSPAVTTGLVITAVALAAGLFVWRSRSDSY